MLNDLTTNNNNDLTIKNKDLVLHQGESSKLFALRNYLNTNKEAIANNASSDVITKLTLNKCLALGLNMSSVNVLKSNNQFLVTIKTKG